MINNNVTVDGKIYIPTPNINYKKSVCGDCVFSFKRGQCVLGDLDMICDLPNSEVYKLSIKEQLKNL